MYLEKAFGGFNDLFVQSVLTMKGFPAGVPPSAAMRDLAPCKKKSNSKVSVQNVFSLCPRHKIQSVETLRVNSVLKRI